MNKNDASMRPPVLPSGNSAVHPPCRRLLPGFNEAAGFTQRKPRARPPGWKGWSRCFNEAAGFTQRKPTGMAKPPGCRVNCFNEAAGFTQRKPGREHQAHEAPPGSFNEAAGFTQRKPAERGTSPFVVAAELQ